MIEVGEDFAGRRHGPTRRATHESDDPAHDEQVTETFSRRETLGTAGQATAREINE
jgi:hypothetical protein